MLLGISLLVVIAFAADIRPSPAKIAVWSNEQFVTSDNKYLSRTIESKVLPELIEDITKNYDYLLLVKSKDSRKSIIQNPTIINALTATLKSTVLPNVYVSRNEEKMSIESIVLNSQAFLKATSLSISDALTTIKAALQSIKSPESFIISISESKSDAEIFDQISALNAKISFVVVDEPGIVAFAPVIKAEYTRLLSNNVSHSNSNSSSTNLYYKPEGAEYSIYYAGTYLYITPDIVTGLITAIFLVLTALLGLSCLGAIQTPSSFSTKIPPVGREA